MYNVTITSIDGDNPTDENFATLTECVEWIVDYTSGENFYATELPSSESGTEWSGYIFERGVGFTAIEQWSIESI